VIPVIRLASDRFSEHPWIFGSSLAKPQQKVPNGSVAQLQDQKGNFLAWGHYNGHARIGFRVLSRDPNAIIDHAFYVERFHSALGLRKMHWQQNWPDAFRLVHSEGDQLSGLVIDVFKKHAVMQFFSAGMFHQREMIIAALKDVAQVESVSYFAEERASKQESFNCTATSNNEVVQIEENGVKFEVRTGMKHKTGFYLDQRANRQRLSEISRGKCVLDVCTFSGGFALSAKVAGHAAHVTGIDLDQEAIAAAQVNNDINQAGVELLQADLYEFLDRPESKNSYDIVIMDPAKLTADRDRIEKALHSYTAMNRLAMQALKVGGTLLACSCSGLVSEEDFLKALRRAAFQAGRTLQIYQITGADIDHPFLASATESRYLKVVWARVL